MLVDPIARNAARARRAAIALRRYCKHGDEPYEMWLLGDLLADLMHLAEREGVDFREMLQRAEMHFTAEVNGEP